MKAKKMPTKCNVATTITIALAAFAPFAVAGGLGSTVGGGVANTANGDYSTVSGGYINHADGDYSVISGGYAGVASGTLSSIPGGSGNFAGGVGSFAGGFHSHVRGDVESGTPTGDDYTFYWADSAGTTPELEKSSGPGQFIVKANGGLSINTVPINRNVSATIAGSVYNPHYASIQLRDGLWKDGILISSGDSKEGANNSSFYVDQYNGSAHTRRLSIDATGNLAITNQAYKPGGGSWAASSDGRLKTNVQHLDHALDRMLALKGVTFEYAHPDDGMHPKGTFSGFIAQDVEKVFPNWIGHDNDGYLTVGPTGFEAITVEALRELKTTQDERVAKLEHDNADLRDLVAQQTKAISDLRHEMAAITSTVDLKPRQVADASTIQQ
jgi:hypothetical protein